MECNNSVICRNERSVVYFGLAHGSLEYSILIGQFSGGYFQRVHRCSVGHIHCCYAGASMVTAQPLMEGYCNRRSANGVFQ